MLHGYRFTDEETLEAIQELQEEHGYIACPHTAVAYLATKAYQEEQPDDNAVCVFLSTAHPCKFPDALPVKVASKIVVPKVVQALKSKPRKSTAMAVDFLAFKSFLLNLD
jgi:threonine synthase